MQHPKSKKVEDFFKNAHRTRWKADKKLNKMFIFSLTRAQRTIIPLSSPPADMQAEWGKGPGHCLILFRLCVEHVEHRFCLQSLCPLAEGMYKT